jgi:uncharacterized protein (TIGR02147 family)
MSNVFEYLDPVDYLNALYAERKARNPRLSISQWAKQLGLKDTASLTRVLARRRKLTPTLGTTLAKALNLQGAELIHFVTATAAMHARDPKKRQIFLETLPREVRLNVLNADQTALLSQWEHVAILETLNLKNARGRAVWIASRLGLSIETVHSALLRLERVGLVERLADGRFVRTHRDKHNFAGDAAPNSAVRCYHRQMSDLAKSALETVPMEERSFVGTTIALSPERFEKAGEILRRASAEIRRLIDDPEASRVYQINLQIFPIVAKG